MAMLVGFDVYGGVLGNGEPYNVKLSARYSYPDIYIIEGSLTQNEKKVGYARLFVAMHLEEIAHATLLVIVCKQDALFVCRCQRIGEVDSRGGFCHAAL